MKTFICVLILFDFGVASGFIFGYDDQACVSGGLPPITRTIDASIPIRVTTPNFNFNDPSSEYPPDTICQWQFNLGNPSLSELELSFNNFSVEYSTDCRNDYVEVRDVDANGLILGTFCARNFIPADIITFNRGLHLKFQSNSNGVESSGFMARAGFPFVVTACDGNGPQIFDDADGGVFQTPEFPNPYENNWACEYKFVAPPGKKVRLSFNNFMADPECNHDYIMVYDGPSATNVNRTLGMWYGSSIPAMITSSTEDLFMTFTTNEDTVYGGFFGTYEMI